MVQAEIICRVIRVRIANNLGTAFSIESHGVQFLVTAKHLFQAVGYPVSTTVSFLIGAEYKPFYVDVRYPSEQMVDIAVMKPKTSQYLTPSYENINSSEGLVYGQDVYFVGFPFEYDSILGMLPGTEMPVPFVKKACLSAFLNDGLGTILLDGINNPGFSGSPVCYKKIGRNEHSMRILGVVSSYRNHMLPLFDKNGRKLDYYVKENTGIIFVSDIRHAVEIADNWN